MTKAVSIQTSNSDDSLPKGTDEEGKVEEEEIQSSAIDDLIQLNVNLSELKHDNISSVSTTEKVPAGEKTLAEQLSGPEVIPLVSVSEKDSEKQSQPAEAEKPGKDVNTSSSEEKKGKQDKEFSFTQTENRSEGLTENLVQDLSSTQPRMEEGPRPCEFGNSERAKRRNQRTFVWFDRTFSPERFEWSNVENGIRMQKLRPFY